MSVIVSDSNNASYNGLLSTANGWYRAEASNLGSWGTPLSLSSTRTIAVTFANAGNLQGVVIGCTFSSYTGTVDRDVTVELVESGTTVRATKTITASTIRSGSTIYYGAWAVPFKFATPYAVDTTASKWTIRISQGSGTSNWNVATSDNTNPFYVAWCDTAVTASSTNDALIIVDDIVINATFVTKAQAVTGSAANAVCGVICETFDATAPYNLTWQNPPASSYTFTIDGQFYISSHAGLQVGTTASPIPIAQYADIKFKRTPSVGTTNSQFGTITTSVQGASRISFDFHGEVATGIKTTLTATAATLQNKINVADPTGFSVNDIIVIGGEQNFGSGSAVQYTINSIASSEFTLNTNIVSFARLSGAEVIKYTLAHGIRYGLDVNSTTVLTQAVYRPANFTWSGVSFFQVSLTLAPNTDNLGLEDATNYNAWEMTDCQVISGGTSNTSGTFFLTSVPPPPKGFTLTRVYAYGPLISTTYKLVHIIGSTITLGGMLAYNYVSSIKANTSSATPNLIYNCDASMQLDMDNCSASNGFVGTEFVGSGSSFTNIKVMCCTDGINVNNLFNPTDISNVDVDYCTYGVIFGTSLRKGACLGFEMADVTFNATASNTNDISFTPGSLIVGIFVRPIGIVTIDRSSVQALVTGSRIGFADYENVANDNRNILVYGDLNASGSGLSDTTVYGSGTYAFYLQPLSSTNLTTWSKQTSLSSVPTGSIQNKDLSVICWVKINSANYYAGTHQMPRLTVTYDDGVSSVYAEAARVTDWQRLEVPVTPTTTFGQIDLTFSAMTDATSTDANVYFANVSVLNPKGTTVDTGDISLWSDALPITPFFATSLSAKDAGEATWITDLTQYTSGQAGHWVRRKLLTVAKFLALK